MQSFMHHSKRCLWLNLDLYIDNQYNEDILLPTVYILLPLVQLTYLRRDPSRVLKQRFSSATTTAPERPIFTPFSTYILIYFIV